MGETAFKVLGPLECWTGGEQVRIRGTKQQIILGALLLADGKPVQLSRLVDAVWGESAPNTANKQIRNAVSDLRQTLLTAEAAIMPAGDGYRLELNSAGLDANEFGDRTARAHEHVRFRRLDQAVAEYRDALALWRGPVLAGLDSPVIQPHVAGLYEQRLTALEECVELELTLTEGSPRSLTAELSALVEEHPFRERFVAQLMLALYRSGAQAAALMVFEQTRRRLQDELGVLPGPELARMHQAILLNEPSLLPSTDAVTPDNEVWKNLPGDRDELIGREEEVRRVLTAVWEHYASPTRAARPAVVALDGMPGIGKTALATHLAGELVSQYPDGQLMLDLLGHTPGRDPMSVSEALTALLCSVATRPGDIPPDFNDRLALWQRRLTGRKVLLVLDNAYSTDQIRPLLPAEPGCLTLVTSRIRLSRLHYTCQLSLGGLTGAAGARLFAHIVGDGRPEAEVEAARRAVAECGGLPLAIRNAGLRLRSHPSWTVDRLAARLSTPSRRLNTLDAEDGGVSQSFATSYERLSPPAQRLLKGLSTMPQTFCASDVAEAYGLSAARAERMLEDLLDVHLLGESTPETYYLHPLLRAYLREPVMGSDGGGDRVPHGSALLPLHTLASFPAAVPIPSALREAGRVPRRGRPEDALADARRD